jgi:NADPH:quinone reductase-like Zn-dependent oxidoreductase
MKAAIFEKPGLENLKIKDDVELPKITDHDVLIRVKMRCKSSISYYSKWCTGD